MINKALLIIYLTLFSCGISHAQTDSARLSSLTERLNTQSETRPIENVYLHLNKPNYYAGDTIWFKGYVTAGEHHQPAALSGVVYTELIDGKGKVISSLKLRNSNGLCAGNMGLDEKLPAGNYRLRAYTTWMRNAGQEYFFSKIIPVFDYTNVSAGVSKVTGEHNTNTVSQTTVIKENIDLQFFPEGGQLVNGVRSKVAFKAIGDSGLGIAVKGLVTDNNNNEVAEFASQHAGMGVFALTPEPGKAYTAKVTLADNTTQTFNLPTAQDKGFVLAVNNSDSTKLTVKIATNQLTLDERKGQSFYIIAQSGGAVYYTTAGKLDEPVFTAAIPKSRLPSGIAQFTLFGAHNEPLNERIAFINNPADQLKLNLATDKQIYGGKEKVSLNLDAKSNTEIPAQGSFSLSVYQDDGTVKENDETTILSHLLLTSDLKGYIEQPNYYFNNPTAQTRAGLDNLMLTQGYRRFEWKDVINDNISKLTFQPEKTLSISGTVTLKNKPVANGKITELALADGINTNTTTDATGRFTLDSLNISDTSNIVIQAQTNDGNKDVKIKLESRTIPEINPTTDNKSSIANLTTTFNNTLNSTQRVQKQKPITLSKNNTLLKEVEIKERKNYGTENAPWVPTITRSANLNGPGHATMIFGTKELENCVDFLECVINQIPNITRIYTTPPFIYYFSRRISQSMTKPPHIQFILNGIMQSDLDLVSNLNTRDVLSVEVLNDNSLLAIYGSEASGGLIIITTKNGIEGNGDLIGEKDAPGIVKLKYKGFDKVREFYVPKYTAKNKEVPDTRDAIYWNPDILTDTAGKASLEFFNSDIKGTYKAVIEGIDNDGHIGRYVYSYKVE